VYRPPIGVTGVGLTDRDRLRNCAREVRRETRQPFRFVIALRRGPVDAGKPLDELVTESPDRVVCSPRLDLHEGTVGDIGHLGREEMTDEFLVHLDFIVVHVGRHARRVSTTALQPVDRITAR